MIIYVLQHLIIQYFYYLSSGRLQEFETKENFKLVVLKVVAVAYEEVVAYKGFQKTRIVIWLGNVWYFGKLLAEER